MKKALKKYQMLSDFLITLYYFNRMRRNGKFNWSWNVMIINFWLLSFVFGQFIMLLIITHNLLSCFIQFKKYSNNCKIAQTKYIYMILKQPMKNIKCYSKYKKHFQSIFQTGFYNYIRFLSLVYSNEEFNL